MITCPSCGRESPEGARFCAFCGAELAAPEPARDERKVVTVVYADLVGSTARAERLDPEDVRAVLAPYHARLRTELERHGGTVEKFIGDAVVGIFGAPAAHEDDAERAVRAALAIQEAIAELNDADPALELEVRIGVNTGEALVALGARPQLGEGMVAGDVMNTGARLQSEAPPGGILVGEATYRATDRAIEYEPVAPLAAKGKSEPLPAWRAVGRRASFGIDIFQNSRARLVGRDRELDVLAHALARVRAAREPQLVTLVGVPGIGKSRLVYELYRIVDADEELIVWRQGRSLPYGDGVTFWALGEMVKAQAGILESDPAEAASEKLASTVADLLPEATESGWVERHTRPLVGLGGEGQSERGEAFAAWRRLLEALAEKGPAILVFEDLHWADDAMLDFVDELVDWVAGVPLLVVATARPELLERRTGWGGGKRNASTLSLAPLSDDDTARLLGDLLEQPLLPAETQAELLARAGGNPLFAEEYARMAAASGGAGVPDSLQAVVTARIDALPAAEKRLVQASSVLGKVFWTDALAPLSDGAVEPLLRALERKEFVRRERRSAVAGGQQYVFVHALVRDVAYGQLTRPERAALHLRAAEWIEQLPPDRSEDRAEVLAEHYAKALDYDRGSGGDDDLRRRASAAFREAGSRAWALSSPVGAAKHYERALALKGSSDVDAALLFEYGRSLSLIGGGGEDELLRSAALFEARGDLEAAAEAQAELAINQWRSARTDAAAATLARAEEMVSGLPPSRGTAFVMATAARLHVLAGRAEYAHERAQAAVAMARSLGLADVEASALNSLGIAKAELLHPDAVEALEYSRRFARDVSATETTRGYINLGSTLGTLGDIRRATEVHREALAYTERLGLGWQGRWLQGELSLDCYWLGVWDEALAFADEVIAAAAASPHYLESTAREVRAAVRLARGDAAGGLDDVTRFVALAREVKDPQVILPSFSLAAFLSSVGGRHDDALAYLDELAGLLASSPPLKSEWYLADLAAAVLRVGADPVRFDLLRPRDQQTPWVVAGVAYASGDFERAADALNLAGALPNEAEARVRAAEAHLAAGRRAQADEQLGRALAFYGSVGASAYIAEAEELLPAAS